MSSLVLTAINVCLILSSNDAKRHEGTIMSYPGVVNHLLKQYATDAKFTRIDEKIHIFQRDLLTVSVFSQKIWDLILSSVCIYNKQRPHGLVPEGIDLYICFFICRRSAGKREETLGYPA